MYVFFHDRKSVRDHIKRFHPEDVPGKKSNIESTQPVSSIAELIEPMEVDLLNQSDNLPPIESRPEVNIPIKQNSSKATELIEKLVLINKSEFAKVKLNPKF